jgi:hypothetical protein
MLPIPFNLFANLWWRFAGKWAHWRHERTWVDYWAVKCYHQGIDEERERSKKAIERAELAGYDRCLATFRAAIDLDQREKELRGEANITVRFYCGECFRLTGATESLTMGCMDEARPCSGCGKPVNCTTEMYHFVRRPPQ